MDCRTVLVGTRWTRVKQLYRGIPLFGKSVTLEYNEEGDPTGKALGHVIKRIRQDVSHGQTIPVDSTTTGRLAGNTDSIILVIARSTR